MSQITTKPYLKSGRKEGVRPYALVSILAIPAVLFWWIRMLLGGTGPDKSLPVPTIENKPTIEVYFDASKILGNKDQNKVLLATKEQINPAFEIIPTKEVPKPTSTPEIKKITSTPDMLQIAIKDEVGSDQVTNNIAIGAQPATNNIAREAEPATNNIENGGTKIYYAPGYEWMKNCEGSKDYWGCVKENNPVEEEEEEIIYFPTATLEVIEDLFYKCYMPVILNEEASAGGVPLSGGVPAEEYPPPVLTGG